MYCIYTLYANIIFSTIYCSNRVFTVIWLIRTGSCPNWFRLSGLLYLDPKFKRKSPGCQRVVVLWQRIVIIYYTVQCFGQAKKVHLCVGPIYSLDFITKLRKLFQIKTKWIALTDYTLSCDNYKQSVNIHVYFVNILWRQSPLRVIYTNSITITKSN